MTNDRVDMRIRRLERRAARLERGLALLKQWDEQQRRPLRAFIAEILDEDPTATDEEIVAALVEKADELASFDGIREFITDVGINVAAEIAVWAYHNRERLITQRIARLRKRIAALRKERDKRSARGGEAVSFGVEGPQDQRAMLVELGMSPKMIDDAMPAEAKPRARKPVTA